MSNDLSTFNGWLAEAGQVLSGKPDWTAIRGDGGYMVAFGGSVYAVTAVVDHDYNYTEDDLIEPDSSAWDDVRGCWAGETPAQTASMLMCPCIVILPAASGVD